MSAWREIMLWRKGRHPERRMFTCNTSARARRLQWHVHLCCERAIGRQAVLAVIAAAFFHFTWRIGQHVGSVIWLFNACHAGYLALEARRGYRRLWRTIERLATLYDSRPYEFNAKTD